MLEILCALVKMEMLGFPLSVYIFLSLSSTSMARQGVHTSLSRGRRQTDGKEEGKPKSHKNSGTGALFHGDHGWQPLLIPAVLCHRCPRARRGAGGTFLRSESGVFSN